MSPAQPSLKMLRALTDENVLRCLIAEPLLTRAQIAARTGISKPTIGDSVQRLTQAGVLRDSGKRTSGRGRVGTYYSLAENIGVALAIDIAPGGVAVEAVDVHGDVVARQLSAIGRPADPDRVGSLLSATVEQVIAGCPGPARLAVVSAADPVDRRSGRLVRLADAPFLVGGLSPLDILGPLVPGPIVVDNDVNWAARAERGAGGSPDLDDFAYLYLGEGVGCALMSDGEVHRGANGIAGEIAHLVTCGPGGNALPFSECFARLQLRQHGSTAIDVPDLLRRIEAGNDEAGQLLDALAQAVGGVIAALIAIGDPAAVIVGGPWGAHPAVIREVTAHMAHHPRSTPIRPPAVPVEPSLTGARASALAWFQDMVQNQEACL